MVLSILWASILNSRSPSSAEIQNFTRRLCGCCNFSPPTTAKSICSLLSFNPSSFANCFRITRWSGGQTTSLSPLRFRVRSPGRFILMWTRTQSSCEKSIVNALPKVVDFLRVLRFFPTEKVDRVG